MTGAKSGAARRITAADAVGIQYEVFGARDDSLPVVLHHGFAASTWVNWVAPGVVSALVAAGRWVVSVDARGHGKSDKPHDPTSYGEALMADDLLRVVADVAVPAYDLVGYSMGAIVALLVAARDGRIRKLVLGGIGAGAVELGGVDRRVLAPEAIVAALETPDPGSITDPMAREFRAFADATGADRAALAAQGRAVHSSPIDFGRIQADTLVLAGEEDPLAARPEVLATAIRSARLLRVAGNHMNALLDPRFTDALVAFLAG